MYAATQIGKKYPINAPYITYFGRTGAAFSLGSAFSLFRDDDDISGLKWPCGKKRPAEFPLKERSGIFCAYIKSFLKRLQPALLGSENVLPFTDCSKSARINRWGKMMSKKGSNKAPNETLKKQIRQVHLSQPGFSTWRRRRHSRLRLTCVP